jgi:phage terminase large subunit-like protein
VTAGALHLWRTAYNPPCTDPLARLMSDEFRDVVWFYENSKVGPELPGKLHAKQVEMLHSAARHRWLFWGNQAGKTAFGAIDLALLTLGRHPVQKWQPPIYCWASALTWELWEKILLPELLTWLPPDRVLSAPPAHRNSTNRDIVILADNGTESRITGKAAQQGADRYQSARIHRIWYDEEHPEAVYDETQPRLLRFGGDSLGTMTPLKGLTYLHSRIYEPWKQGREEARDHFCSHAGIADNPSMKPEVIDELKRELRNNPAQLEARLYGHFVRPFGSVWPYKEAMLVDLTLEDVKIACRRDNPFCGLDLGKWRWAFTFYTANTEGVVTLQDEIFSQNEDVDTRAKKLKALGEHYDWPEYVSIRCDCADPDLVIELNNALERCGSPWMVQPVDARNKIIAAGVDRVESLMNRGAFKVRRGIGNGQVWKLGMNSGKPGKPIEGSRWMWEVNNWQYPKVDEAGKVKIQKDVPDDATADGADMMDSTRYAIMSWYTPDKPEPPKYAKTVIQRIQEELRELEHPQPKPDYGRPLRQ